MPYAPLLATSRERWPFEHQPGENFVVTGFEPVTSRTSEPLPGATSAELHYKFVYKVVVIVIAVSAIVQ